MTLTFSFSKCNIQIIHPGINEGREFTVIKEKKSSKPVQQRTVGGQRPKTADDIQGLSRGTFQG